MNNKKNIIVKTLIAGLACVAICGTTIAAPHCGGKAPQKAPTHQKAPAHRQDAPALQHHAPAPHHAPRPPARDHGGHHEGAGWLTLGAAVLGGIVGGIVGACN